jgi:TDG/mug DNA glycosylase family protein
MTTLVNHTFGPVFDEKSTRLILGSFPSVKSREQSFYYMNPNNRFWKVLEYLTKVPYSKLTIEEKIKQLKNNQIALYDVVFSCEIEHSSDATIQKETPVCLEDIMIHSNIKQIILNGKKAEELFKKYFSKYLPLVVSLPSTSSANASYSLSRLCETWEKYWNQQNV